MKKFLVLLFVFLFTTGNAFAWTEVRSSNTGRPIASHRGAMRPASASFGQGALFTPRNRAIAGRLNRMAQRERAITHAMRNMYNQRAMNGQANAMQGGARSPQLTTTSRPVSVSRFNKNYKISTQTKSRTNNGITYYN